MLIQKVCFYIYAFSCRQTSFKLQLADKVDFQTDVALQNPQQSKTSHTCPMEDNLNVICQFADMITNTLKRFVELCKEEKRRRQSGISEFSQLQEELIRQRKKRMELEEMVRKVGNSAGDPALNDILNSYQERKRPRTAFALFLADYREKILRNNPNFAMSKVVNIGRIKWKMLSKEEQDAYQKKLQAINRYCIERDISQGNAASTEQQIAVKRQFGCDEEMQREKEGNYQNNDGPEQGRENNGQSNQEHDHQSAQNNRQNGIQGTMMASMAEEEPIPQRQQPPREKTAIENILDLFHTQTNNTTVDPQPHQITQNEMVSRQQQVNDPPNPIPHGVDNNPSLVMIDLATASHPLVIPPTIQE